MRAGELDRWVRLEKRQVQQETTYGDAQTVYTLIAEVWAKKREASTRDGFAAEQTFAEGLVEWTIRYRADVGPQDRVVWDGNAYDIFGVPQELGRREGLRLLTRVVNPA
jgi:SPP1 family predicted phage head-tail adaptor